MITHKLLNVDAKEVGEMELKDQVFGVKPKKHLVKDMVVMQLAGRRSGTASTKTRKEVRGGGKKPFRQKGTGNARQGTSRSPLMPGGGIVFGPHPRDYSYRIPAKVRKTALKTALMTKKEEGKLFLFESLDLKSHKTREALAIFGKLKILNALVIDNENRNLELAVRNIKGFKFLRPEGVNVYDILKHESLVVTKGSMEKIEEALSK